jgi:hypothetical protein
MAAINSKQHEVVHSRRTAILTLLAWLSMVAPAQVASEATAAADATGPAEQRESPWLLDPRVSPDPKMI